jgi:cytochrome P450
MKWGWIVTFSRYTESWRLARKLLDRSLRPATIAAYRPLLQTRAHVLLTQVLENPDDFEAHLNQFVVFLWRYLFLLSIVQNCSACRDPLS